MKILQTAIEEYFGKVKKDKTPKCFTDEKEYNQWITLESDAPTEPRKFPCRDCNSGYQNKMKTAGKCYIPLVPVEKIVR